MIFTNTFNSQTTDSLLELLFKNVYKYFQLPVFARITIQEQCLQILSTPRQ